LNHEEWVSLSDTFSAEWMTTVVLPLFSAPTSTPDVDIEWIRALIQSWMNGSTYAEISLITGRTVDECLDGLIHTVGFALQDSLSKTTQLALLKYGEDAVSELAASWVSMLQYGLSTLQQLDLFEHGASDRLGVWSLSRFLANHSPESRGPDVVAFLRSKSMDAIKHLKSDLRVPTLSANRTILELRLSVPRTHD
jgi:helicase